MHIDEVRDSWNLLQIFSICTATYFGTVELQQLYRAIIIFTFVHSSVQVIVQTISNLSLVFHTFGKWNSYIDLEQWYVWKPKDIVLLKVFLIVLRQHYGTEIFYFVIRNWLNYDDYHLNLCLLNWRDCRLQRSDLYQNLLFHFFFPIRDIRDFDIENTVFFKRLTE